MAGARGLNRRTNTEGTKGIPRSIPMSARKEKAMGRGDKKCTGSPHDLLREKTEKVLLVSVLAVIRQSCQHTVIVRDERWW